MFFKCAELGAEAIPCTVLQVFAMIFNGDWSAVPMASLLISAFVSGMSSSMMSYIVDTSMISRSNAGS
jgi:hypothetical protein